MDFSLIKKEALKYLTKGQKASEKKKDLTEFSALCSAQAILALIFGKHPIIQVDSLFENLENLNVRYQKCIQRRKQLERLLKARTENQSPTKVKVTGSGNKTPIKRKIQTEPEDDGIAYTYKKKPKIEEPENLNFILPDKEIENAINSIDPNVDFTHSEMCGVTFDTKTLNFEQDIDLVRAPTVDPLVVDHDYIKPEELQKEQYPDGYFSVSAEMLNQLKNRYKGEECVKAMLSKKHTNGSHRKLVACRNQDPTHHHEYVKEWFATSLLARLRSKTLDPYNYLKEQNKGKSFSFHCREYGCTAHMQLRQVDASDNGNVWGLIGCLSHSHPEQLNNRMEIVFDNYYSALEFHNHYLEPQYSKQSGSMREEREASHYMYSIFYCKRRTFAKGKDGKCDCDSRIHFKMSFAYVTLKNGGDTAKNEPFSLIGNFFHKHPRDPRYFNVPLLVKNYIDSELERGVSPNTVFKNFVPDVNQKNPTIDYIRDRLRLIKRRERLKK